MVRCVQRIHQACEPQSRTPREQRLPQVLWSLQILQVLNEELGGSQILHHTFHLLLLVITQDHYLIDSKDCSCLSDLAHQVGLQLHGLGIIDDRGRYNNRKRVPPESVRVQVFIALDLIDLLALPPIFLGLLLVFLVLLLYLFGYLLLLHYLEIAILKFTYVLFLNLLLLLDISLQVIIA